MNFCYINIFFEASIPVTLAPSLHMGSDNRPPPQPISSKENFFKGFFELIILKCSLIFFFIYPILTGLNLCNDLNFPIGFHHSLDSFENFSISL